MHPQLTRDFSARRFQDRIKDACMRYAKMETMLGEVSRNGAVRRVLAQTLLSQVDRARGIYVNA